MVNAWKPLRGLMVLCAISWLTLVHALPGDPPHADTLTALVIYGDGTLIPDDGAFTDDDLEDLLDSLCALPERPLDLIRDLRLFKRIRTLDREAMALLIDSLFDLDTIPYALVNEINLYASHMPSQEEVDASRSVAWRYDPAHEDDPDYGGWITTDPNAYGKQARGADTTLMVRLVDEGSNCGFAMPITGVLTSRFGWRDGRAHNGVDLDLEVWDPVHSAFPGVVRFAGVFGGFGRLVVVRHFNGLETFYAHLHRFKVKAGDVVDAGTVVGLGGSSGHSTGSHLHFEVRYRGVPIDPARLIDLSDGELLSDTLVLRKVRTTYAAYPRGTRFHTVRKGDHLYGIAESYGTTIQALCALNGIDRRTILRVGQQLLVTADGAR
ncbi:MAG: peptidoglycan DD-metalloendopeptidase family protein [Flavobacteriales bacterium]|nr:peptidoglycan DD-metalloendopeptidase family protein [Flavobacteriales bacterium]MCB9166287.1 peptidoglycan DD-metalloendopeptidase family protein [Flavobacteriales bacterium]